MTVALQPVRLIVTDAAGHPLEGAPVQVYQRVLAWEGTCTGASAPCAAAPVLATSQITLSSDENGSIQLTPLQVPGVPQVLEVAAITGAQGFATLTLDEAP